MQPLAWSLLSLVLVLALIPIVLWSVKRLQTLRHGGHQPQLQILSQIALGTRERVVMVRVQDRILVLGATAQSITFLTEADAMYAPEVAPAPPIGDSFTSVLKSFQSGSPTRSSTS